MIYVFIKDYLRFREGDICTLPNPMISCLLNNKIVEKQTVKPLEIKKTEIALEELNAPVIKKAIRKGYKKK